MRADDSDMNTMYHIPSITFTWTCMYMYNTCTCIVCGDVVSLQLVILPMCQRSRHQVFLPLGYLSRRDLSRPNSINSTIGNLTSTSHDMHVHVHVCHGCLEQGMSQVISLCAPCDCVIASTCTGSQVNVHV